MRGPSYAEGPLPSPSFSHAILEVEKAAYLGLEATLQECCSIGERGVVDNARCGNFVDCLGTARKSEREKVLRDNIVRSR